MFQKFAEILLEHVTHDSTVTGSIVNLKECDSEDCLIGSVRLG